MSEFTGVDDYKNMRKLIKFTNVLSEDFWQKSEVVSGKRETKQFPYDDWVTEDSILEIWAQDKYRSVNYTFDEWTQRDGLDLMRFRIANETYLNADNYPYNQKFYQFGENGILNLTDKDYLLKRVELYFRFENKKMSKKKKNNKYLFLFSLDFGFVF